MTSPATPPVVPTGSVRTIHSADVVVPITSAPIGGGAIVVADGTIVAVGPLDAARADYPDAAHTRWPGVLVAGLVNAHTHLQYTSFASVGATQYVDYTAWSARFVEEYDLRHDADWRAIARRGAQEMIASGVTAIGDVVTDLAARDVLVDLDIPGVAYLELIGVDLEDWNGGVGAGLRDAVSSAPTSPWTTVGISPHAPYSVDEPVLTAMADLARDLGVRLHIHVGESDGEDEFYRTGTGSLAERVRRVATRRVGILERGGSGMGTAELTQNLGLLGPTCHIAHGVYLGREGRAIMAANDTVVALCPRSNRIVGIDDPPVGDYLRESVPFAVGTDSLSSSPSLDLMADVKSLHDLAVAGGYTADDLDDRLLHAATMGGATALGLDAALGSLEVGKRADFAVFDLPGSEPVSAANVARRLVHDGASHCTATVIRGVTRRRPLPPGSGTSGNVTAGA